MSVVPPRDELTDNERALQRQLNMLSFNAAKEIGRLEIAVDKLARRVVELEQVIADQKFQNFRHMRDGK